MVEVLLSLFVLSALAGFVQRVSGFGFGIFIMMFLPYIMPSYNEAVALSGILSGLTALFIVMRNVSFVRWSKMPVVLLANIIVSYFAIIYMQSVGGLFMHRCLGLILVLVAVYFLFFQDKACFSFSSWWSKCAAGALSGVMGSMFAMPGPPVVVYGVSVFRDKKEYMATMQAFWLLFNIFYLLFRSGRGYYAGDTPVYWLAGIAGVLPGLWLGGLCFNSLGNLWFRRVVYSVMLFSGAAAFFKQ